MSNTLDSLRNGFMLKGNLAQKGYDTWRHTFTGINCATGEEENFFIEYFVCNPFYIQKTPVLGQHSFNKNHGYLPSYLMVKAGWWGKDACQIHRFFSWKDTFIKDDDNLYVLAGDCLCSDENLRGEIKLSKSESIVNPQYMCDYGEMQWELKVKKEYSVSNNTFYENILCKINGLDTHWYISALKAKFDGYVIKNGARYEINPETCNGYCDKNWGKNFPNPWITLASNKLRSKSTGKYLKNSAFSIVGCPPCVCGCPTKHKLFSHLLYENKYYDFNFLKALSIDKTRYKITDTEKEIFWNVWQENTKSVLEAKIRCCKSDMLLLNYESPDGQKLHNNLWSGGNACGILYLWKKKLTSKTLIDKLIADNVCCQYGVCDKN